MSGPSSTAAVLRPDRELLTASLLLCLARGSGYGYGLAEQLRDEALEVEMTVVYRVLRALEADRQVTSRWIDSATGPRRRLYSLTATGRRTLDGLVAAVLEQRDRYCDFADAYAEAGRGGGAPRPAPGSSAPPGVIAPRADRDLLIAWLLFLLDGEASYGYDLRRHLAEHDLKADPGQVYRLLRRLDADGLLRSRWSDPILGPRRRVYRLTADGRRALDKIAGSITRACDVLDAFADAYEHVNDDYRGPAVPQRRPRPRQRRLSA